MAVGTNFDSLYIEVEPMYPKVQVVRHGIVRQEGLASVFMDRHSHHLSWNYDPALTCEAGDVIVMEPVKVKFLGR